MRVLVLGGAGYIGSHTCMALVAAGHEVGIVDNFSNASRRVPQRLAGLLGRELPTIECDIRDTVRLSRAMADRSTEAVVHFAALKAVGDSMADPLAYFDNNVCGTISVLRAMRQASVRHLVFSSSATVYAAGGPMPIREDGALGPANPYGRSKLVMEQLISDVCVADAGMGAMLLRYFNPAGAHPSGMIGEDPCGVPDNLMPVVAQVAVGRRDRLHVFGEDWPTPDGTGIRDYVHVMDLARAHVDALSLLEAGRRGATAMNLGTGRGTSVLELVRAEIWAAPDLAHELMGWTAEHGIERMCEDAWRWQQANPDGYG